jgi:phage-related minor tail protein
MSEIDELKEQIKALNSKIELLEKQLKDNSEADEKRHQEVQELQKQQHQDNLF